MLKSVIDVYNLLKESPNELAITLYSINEVAIEINSLLNIDSSNYKSMFKVELVDLKDEPVKVDNLPIENSSFESIVQLSLIKIYNSLKDYKVKYDIENPIVMPKPLYIFDINILISLVDEEIDLDIVDYKIRRSWWQN